jgi:hypothetical protein
LPLFAGITDVQVQRCLEAVRNVVEYAA